jgi:hypothetical protein
MFHTALHTEKQVKKFMAGRKSDFNLLMVHQSRNLYIF